MHIGKGLSTAPKSFRAWCWYSSFIFKPGVDIGLLQHISFRISFCCHEMRHQKCMHIFPRLESAHLSSGRTASSKSTLMPFQSSHHRSKASLMLAHVLFCLLSDYLLASLFDKSVFLLLACFALSANVGNATIATFTAGIFRH